MHRLHIVHVVVTVPVAMSVIVVVITPLVVIIAGLLLLRSLLLTADADGGLVVHFVRD